MTSDDTSPNGDAAPADPIPTALEARTLAASADQQDVDPVGPAYDQLVDLAIAGQPTTPAVDYILTLFATRPDRDTCVATLAVELLSDLETTHPDEQSPLEPPATGFLRAIQHLTVTEQIPDTAWTLTYDIDPATAPAAALSRYDTAIGLLSSSPASHPDLAGLHAGRADTYEQLDNHAAALTDWATAYQLANTDNDRHDHALAAAITAHDLDDLDGAADWAWTAASYLNPADTPDQDETDGIVWIYTQAFERERQRSSGEVTERLQLLMNRLREHTDWIPPDQVTAVHATAARLHLTRNDPAAAAAEITAGRAGWPDAPEIARVAWHLASGMTGALQQDLGTVEEAVRQATPTVQSFGDEADQADLAGLVSWLAANTGQVAAVAPDHPAGLLTQISLRLRDPNHNSGQDLTDVDHAITAADQAGLPHLSVGGLAMRAVINARLGNLSQARDDLDAADAGLSQLLTQNPGGFPAQALRTFIDLNRIALAADQPSLSAGEQADQLWRCQLRDGFLPGAAAAAALACLMWHDLLHQPRRALPAGVAALTAAQEIVTQRGRSEDRLSQATGMLDGYRQLALRAAHATGDHRIMAEILEVARAQEMPQAGPPIASITELAGQLSPYGVVSLDLDPQPATGTTRIRPTPLVVMPWGSIALAEHLAYPRDTQRGYARLVLGWPDLPQT